MAKVLTSKEYILHHLENWQVSLGQGDFWTVNVTRAVSVLMGLIVVGVYLYCAARITSGVYLGYKVLQNYCLILSIRRLKILLVTKIALPVRWRWLFLHGCS